MTYDDIFQSDRSGTIAANNEADSARSDNLIGFYMGIGGFGLSVLAPIVLCFWTQLASKEPTSSDKIATEK